MKNQLLSLLVLLFWGVASVNALKANALNITNLTRDSVNQTVTFSIEWDNSWRVDTTGAPYNWDAAWIFIKFRPCGAASTTPWTHAKLDPTSALNNFSTLQPHAIGYAGGFYPDSNGVMLRRPSNGIFPNAAPTTVTIRIANIPNVGQFDLKVFGIEMVYVVQESFSLGLASPNYYTFNDGTGNPRSISSEAATLLHSANSNNTVWGSVNVNLPAAFPKGYKAFYIMKYEISEGQYAAFLNTITSPAQLNRYPGNYFLYRNRLNNNGAPPDIYVAEREDRAQNYLSFEDLATYLDWACLRPLSELEYEKACRGNAPSVLNEYAWGTNTFVQAQTISTAPEDGTETIFAPVGANCSYGNYLYNGGDGDRGPLRVGIFARPTSNSRVGTGASFYGVMEMSGNVRETVIDFRHTAFDGSWGNGYITSAGMYDVATWPTTGTAYGWRGGSFYDSDIYMRVSERLNMGQSSFSNSRNLQVGGRGAR